MVEWFGHRRGVGPGGEPELHEREEPLGYRIVSHQAIGPETIEEKRLDYHQKFVLSKDNKAVNPGLINQFMVFLEDYGIVKLVGDPKSHKNFEDAMHKHKLSFPFVQDWMIWGFIAFSLFYVAIQLKLV